jgi:lysophospholipase L1-like esterase
MRGRLGALALAAASLLLTFAVLELIARRLEGPPGEPVAARYTEHDPVLGWRHRPGARVDFPQGPYVINARGLRDRERDYAAAPGVERVLVLGDSFAEGFSVRLEDAVSQVLERRLTARGCPVEVINGGTVGYSTDQEYLFYREEGARYAPRVVVLLLYYNDVLYDGRAGVGTTPKPLFTFAGGEPRVKNMPLPVVEPFRAPEAGPPPGGSAALRWLEGRLANGWPAAHSGLARLGLWRRRFPQEPPLEMRIYQSSPPDEVGQAWLFARHLLRFLNEDVSARGARLLVAYVPSKMEVSERDWALTRSRYALGEGEWERGRLAGLLTAAGGDLGFPVLDLTGPLRKAERGVWGGPYHAEGGHWNALGHRVAAEEVERAVTAAGWLPACKGPVPESGTLP